MKKKLQDNQIAFYQTVDGSINIEVLYADENIWLTQKRMAELFDTTPQNITQHLKNVYAENEADKITTCKDFLQFQSEGGRDIGPETHSLQTKIGAELRFFLVCFVFLICKCWFEAFQICGRIPLGGLAGLAWKV